MRYIKVLLLLAFFVFGWLFFQQNGATLENTLFLKLQVSRFAWQADSPFYLVILASFAVGALFATIYLLIDRVRLSCTLMSRNRTLRAKEKELGRLRAELEKESKIIEAQHAEVKKLPEPAPEQSGPEPSV